MCVVYKVHWGVYVLWMDRPFWIDGQVFYSICGCDHPSERSIVLRAAFINGTVSG